jgi:site-specific recombinase XerD
MQKRVSPATVASYRDTFRLLLQFIQEKKGIVPAALRIPDLDVAVILSFLDYLEQSRKNSIRSRNVRLAAIRSFFRAVALREPTSVAQCACILAIPLKRADHRLVNALSRNEMDALLSTPDLSCSSGRRDHAMLLTLYNTGARVSEIMVLEQSQVHFGTTAHVCLHGKGRKERTVPLWTRTARALQSWFDEPAGSESPLAFPNAQGKRMTRNGVDYILQKAAVLASANCPSLAEKRITPHMCRHTCATHLLESGVDISVIALWLGHESIETTHIYVEVDLASKERALNKLSPAGSEIPRFKAQDDVLAFLSSL